MSSCTLAIYPGSFDPVTYGHLDIIERASRLFPRLLVGVGGNPAKRYLFTREQRLQMVKEACARFPNVEVDSFSGLLVNFVAERAARVVVRGLRAVSDFESELQSALTNRMLHSEVETIFLMTSPEHLYLSSSVVREIAGLGGPVEMFVPPHVEALLREKFPLRA